MGSEATPSYEELRQRKLEENKRKLEELKLNHFSLTLRNSLSPKTSPAKAVKRKIAKQDGQYTPPRRSSRVAKLPEQNYREVASVDLIKRPKRAFNHQRCLSGRVYASDEARMYATTRAEEIESELGSEFPSFVKPMTQSHVTGGFWLGLPKYFCISHLPKRDSPITLVNEKGDDFETLYLYNKTGLSAGWRGFSIFHELVDGDALVFQLIKPTTFKVYIVRASSYYADDVASDSKEK